jgi:hypothetical protein
MRVEHGNIRSDLSVDYAIGAFCPPTAPVAHTLWATLGLTSAQSLVRPTGQLLVGYHLPELATGFPAAVRIDGAGFRALVGVAIVPSHAWTLSFAAGGGADVSYMQPNAALGGTITLDPPRLVTLPMFRTEFRVARALTPIVWLEAGVSCEVDVSGTHYDVQFGNALVPVIHPWLVRPGAFVGLAFILSGVSR